MKDNDAYSQFYEEIGSKYPEGQLARVDRRVGTHYWTIMQELIPYARRNSSLLDIGCNDGVFSIPYARLGGYVVGIDISKTLIAKAKTYARSQAVDSRCEFFQSDVESLELDRQFDVVLFSEVLEHLRNPSFAMKTISKLMRNRGILLLTTPTPIHHFRYFVNILSPRKLLEIQFQDTEKNKLRDFGVSSHLYRHDGYYPLGLIQYVKSFGFRCEKMYTTDFPIPGRRGELVLRHVPILKLLGFRNFLVVRKV